MASQQQQASITSFLEGGNKRWTNKKTTTRKRKGSSFGACPLCHRSFPWHTLEPHAATCNGTPISEPKHDVLISAVKDTKRETNVDVPIQHRSSSNNNKNNNNNNTFPSHARQTEDGTKMGKKEFCTHTDEPIPGLFVFKDFITEEEEQTILDFLDDTRNPDDSLRWKAVNFNGMHYGKRWGVHCNLRDRKVSAPEHALPDFIESLLQPRLHRQIRVLQGWTPNEANAIDYRRQQGHSLAAHVDDRQLSKEPIANLSLAGDCVMTFCNTKANTATTAAAAPPMVRVRLPRRCLQVLTGKARYDYSHAIANSDLLSDRRVSITMRESPLSRDSRTTLQRGKTTATPWWEKKQSTPTGTAIRPPCPTAEEPLPGLLVWDDFITLEEEALILNELDTIHPPWKQESHSGRHNEKRFGVDHDLWNRYSVRAPKHALPNFMHSLILPRLAQHLSSLSFHGYAPNEINAIEYRRAQGHWLASHVDDRQKHSEPICNLSLAGDCIMTYQKQQTKGGGAANFVPVEQQRHRVLLKRRCLQIMTGKARYEYSHGIANADLLAERRVSVTMRETPRKKYY